MGYLGYLLKRSREVPVWILYMVCVRGGGQGRGVVYPRVCLSWGATVDPAQCSTCLFARGLTVWIDFLFLKLLLKHICIDLHLNAIGLVILILLRWPPIISVMRGQDITSHHFCLRITLVF